MPLTVLATVAIWLLALRRPIASARRAHHRAALIALAAMAVNVLIVSTIIPHLFGDEYLQHASELEVYCRRWNALNVVRMTLVGLTCAQLFGALLAWDAARLRLSL